jgi:23S rRNA pseudouridine955/2504/2580 synthase
MHNDRKAEGEAPAAPGKVALYDVGEDDAGIRLDRWLRRRFPDLSNAHLMKIVRKGEVRVRRCACRR